MCERDGRDLSPTACTHRARPDCGHQGACLIAGRSEGLGGRVEPRRGQAMSGPRVVVVGGGLAGVSAALSAADGGAEVVLLERRGKLGGLTWSFKRKGRAFDNGQHVFMRCCTAYMEFLERIGGSGQASLRPRLEVPVLSPGGKKATISRGHLPAPLHLAGSLAGYRHISFSERFALPRAVLALRALDLSDPELDSMTFGQWLRDRGQSVRAIERLWDLIALPTL